MPKKIKSCRPKKVAKIKKIATKAETPQKGGDRPKDPPPIP